MRKYSDFFQTLHNEQNPTGYLGRGTHYSVLRAVVFHDEAGGHLSQAQFCDFAVIWDEDHDERVIEPIEIIYRSGLLSSFLFFGERKGGFTALFSEKVHDLDRRTLLHDRIEEIAGGLSDPWFTCVANPTDSNNSIISDASDKVELYLANLRMLWRLGLKAATRSGGRVLPGVSTAAGGLMPGIDLNNSAALQEMDDLEAFHRLK